MEDKIETSLKIVSAKSSGEWKTKLIWPWRRKELCLLVFVQRDTCAYARNVRTLFWPDCYLRSSFVRPKGKEYWRHDETLECNFILHLRQFASRNWDEIEKKIIWKAHFHQYLFVTSKEKLDRDFRTMDSTSFFHLRTCEITERSNRARHVEQINRKKCLNSITPN